MDSLKILESQDHWKIIWKDIFNKNILLLFQEKLTCGYLQEVNRMGTSRDAFKCVPCIVSLWWWKMSHKTEGWYHLFCSLQIQYNIIFVSFFNIIFSVFFNKGGFFNVSSETFLNISLLVKPRTLFPLPNLMENFYFLCSKYYFLWIILHFTGIMGGSRRILICSSSGKTDFINVLWYQKLINILYNIIMPN